MPNPQTPDVGASKMKKTKKEVKPTKAKSPATPGAGFTLYDRTKLQIEERERKLKALQEKLMADYTFTPKSATSSMSSSLASGSPEKVFDRLYGHETAAMRARRISPRSATNSPFSTPNRPRAQSLKDGYVTPTRLLNLHEEGQNRLRARVRSQKVCNVGLCYGSVTSDISLVHFLLQTVGGRRSSTKKAGGRRTCKMYLYSKNQVEACCRTAKKAAGRGPRRTEAYTSKAQAIGKFVTAFLGLFDLQWKKG